MAYVYAQSMQLELAKSEFSKALSIDPNCASAAEGLMQVCNRIPGNEPKTVLSAFAVSKSTPVTESKEDLGDVSNSFELRLPNSGTTSIENSGNIQTPDFKN